jgi:hypothetical protein
MDVKRVDYFRWFTDVITADVEGVICLGFIYRLHRQEKSHVLSATNPHEIKDIPLHDQEVCE